MRLALIAPTSALEEFASQSNGVHLVLAPVALRDVAYRDFYRKRADAGDLIVLDNGAFEFGIPLPVPDILEAARAVSATTVVAPDFPKQNWRITVTAALEFATVLPKRYGIFVCPQSEIGDVEGWLDGFEQLRAVPRLTHIGMSILACPNAFCELTGTGDIELNRLVATAYVKRQILSKHPLGATKIHYLGLGHRLDLIRHYDIASSLDTSSPVWHGWHGISYGYGFLPGGKLALPVDFGAPALPANDLRRGVIQSNIDTLKKHAADSEIY